MQKCSKKKEVLAEQHQQLIATDLANLSEKESNLKSMQAVINSAKSELEIMRKSFQMQQQEQQASLDKRLVTDEK